MPSEHSARQPTFEAAAAAHDAGDIETAHAYLVKLLEGYPDEARVYAGLATIASEKGEYEQAVGHLTRMLELERSAEGLIARSEALAKAGNLPKALADAEAAIQIDPDSSQGYTQCGNILREQDESLKAQDRYEQALMRDEKDVNARYALAELLVDRGEHRQAIEHYTRLIELRPNVTGFYGMRGDSELALGDFDGALEDYAQVSQLDDDDALSYRRRGDVYWEKGEFAHALEMYQKALDRDPEDPETHNGMGLICESRGDFGAALEHYDRVVQLAPKSPIGWKNRGFARIALADYRTALQDFAKAIALRPDLPAVYRGSGDAYLKLSNYPRALGMYEEALRRDENDPEAHRGIGRLYEAQGDLRKALEHFDKLVQLVPEDAVGYCDRGDVYAAMKEYDKALADFRCSGDMYRLRGEGEKALRAYQRALELDPEDADTHNGIGLVKKDEGNFEDSLAHFKRVIDLDPESPVGYSRCGDLYHDREDYRRAIDYYSQAIERESEPANAHLYVERGSAYLGQDNWEQALLDFDKALELDPSDSGAHFGRGQVFAAQRAYSEALAEYNRGIELAPENSLGYFYRGVLLQTKEDYLGALANFQKLAALLPSSAEPRSYLGSVLVSLKGYDRAVDAFAGALEISPNSLETLIDKADALRLWGLEFDSPDKLVQAVETVEAALKLDDLNSVAFGILGSALVSLPGGYTDGIHALKEAFDINPQFDWAVWELGKALYRAGDFTAAEKAFRDLGALGDQFAMKCKLGRALALREQSKMTDSGNLLRSTLEGAPDQAAAYLERGFLFVELREWQAAIDDFRRATEQNPRLIDAQNGLAWYQAEKLGTNLDESLAAAERALELAGPDPLLRAMVIDTVGWVHYKRSELEAAKQCVEEAVRLNDTSLYVRNHLAVLNSTVRAAV